MRKGPFLIVGLGNVGSDYELTRHNLGFMVVEAIAKRLNLSFKKERSRQAHVAQTMRGEEKIYLALPTTYMNRSGDAVRSLVAYYKIPLDNLLVISDDIALEFGAMRLRAEGSSGGQKGLKSIENSLGTQKFARLRVGIGDRQHGDLADYVLSRFSADEQKRLPELLTDCEAMVDKWLEGVVSTTLKTSQDGEKNETAL